MSGKQQAVLWMGIILVALNLNWAALKGIIFSGSSSSGSGSGGIHIPLLPLIPGSPGVTIPVGAQGTPVANHTTVT